jgi:hypothetical protein
MSLVDTSQSDVIALAQTLRRYADESNSAEYAKRLSHAAEELEKQAAVLQSGACWPPARAHPYHCV